MMKHKAYPINTSRVPAVEERRRCSSKRCAKSCRPVPLQEQDV
jgi:hypothetical protein